MKNVLFILLTLIALITLEGCGTDIQSDLQSKEWNVVSTNGEAYTAQFGEETVTFEMLGFQLGYTYKIVDNVITFQENGEEESFSFEVTENEDDYQLKAANEDVKKENGDLTLSPRVNK